MRKFFVYLLLLGGVSCVTAEQDDRICIDWDSRTVIQERCIPMYGALICVDEEKVQRWCVLYAEPSLKRVSDES